MGGKKKKAKSKASKAPADNKKGKSTGKSKKSVRKGGRLKSSKCSVDIFTEAAMENAYSTCHNVQDLLFRRGFPWPEAQKKKKKGKK